MIAGARLRSASLVAWLACSFIGTTARADVETASSGVDFGGAPAAAPKKFKPRLSASADVGLVYNALYGSHFWGGDLRATAGVELKPGALLLSTDLLYGSTEFGLTTWDWHIAPMWEFRFKRIRAGLGPSASYLQIARVTTPAHPFWNVGVGVEAEISVDLLQLPASGADGRPTAPHALYAALRFNADAYLEQKGSEGATYGPALALGFRY